MKLRNKKTGEIGQIGYVATNDGAIIVEDISGSEYPFSVISNYKTLTKLNEDWEDYKPAEPLIKDEKIRKAVKAWAEANDFTNEIEVRSLNAGTRFSEGHWSIEFIGYFIYDLKIDSTYTIDELCGEDKE